jgi:hypothetical protein
MTTSSPPGLVDHRSHGGVGRLLGRDVELHDTKVDAGPPRGILDSSCPLAVAAVDVAHAGVDGVPGGCQVLGGDESDAGSGAGHENDGHELLLVAFLRCREGRG